MAVGTFGDQSLPTIWADEGKQALKTIRCPT
jgi:hypothetical protein